MYPFPHLDRNLMSNAVIYCIHDLSCHRKSGNGIIFGKRYGTDIIDEPEDELDRALDDK